MEILRKINGLTRIGTTQVVFLVYKSLVRVKVKV